MDPDLSPVFCGERIRLKCVVEYPFGLVPDLSGWTWTWYISYPMLGPSILYSDKESIDVDDSLNNNYFRCVTVNSRTGEDIYSNFYQLVMSGKYPQSDSLHTLHLKLLRGHSVCHCIQFATATTYKRSLRILCVI